MKKSVGIRHEDKSVWEKRVPIVPQDAEDLVKTHGIEVQVQPSPTRVFKEDLYKNAGAAIKEKLDAPFIIGVKEMPSSFFEENKTYLFFSHTIKAQDYNMPMLKKMIDLKTTLIDYEKIADSDGRRLIAFGKYAGIAGMIDTIWSLGKKWEHEGIANPLSEIKQSKDYDSLDEFRAHAKKVSDVIKTNGFPKEVSPVVVGFAGYGNVSGGAQEMIDLFPVKEVMPSELDSLKADPNIIYKVVFKEMDMVRESSGGAFELQDYFSNPQKYEAILENQLDKLTALVNCIYWDERYPRIVTKKWLKDNYTKDSKLKVLGDVTCDIDGSIECTVKATEPGDPIFTYDPQTDSIKMGHEGNGPVILAVDILPSEVPKDASEYFSHLLKPFIVEILNSDFPEDFNNCTLPEHLKKAVIVYKGNLTPDYEYLKEHIK